ncbi:hypothetical protein H8A95_14660, partial [Bradyrhizobium sp. Pear76]|nr:hypothetical protein [Bradyrhizobium oropedii]
MSVVPVVAPVGPLPDDETDEVKLKMPVATLLPLMASSAPPPAPVAPSALVWPPD